MYTNHFLKAWLSHAMTINSHNLTIKIDESLIEKTIYLNSLLIIGNIKSVMIGNNVSVSIAII